MGSSLPRSVPCARDAARRRDSNPATTDCFLAPHFAIVLPLIVKGDLTMQALEGERTLLTVASLTITTHRVRETLKGGGAGQVTGIMLNEVSGCAVTHVSKPYLLNLAGLLLFVSIVGGIIGIPSSNESPTVLILGIIATLILGVAYFATRKNVVRVSPLVG
jgi:hypothetical protein